MNCPHCIPGIDNCTHDVCREHYGEKKSLDRWVRIGPHGGPPEVYARLEQPDYLNPGTMLVNAVIEGVPTKIIVKKSYYRREFLTIPDGSIPTVQAPSMKYPHATLGGKTFDLYDIAAALGVTSPPLFNAFKKLVRRGNGAKSERTDLEEAKRSIDRYLRDLPPEVEALTGSMP